MSKPVAREKYRIVTDGLTYKVQQLRRGWGLAWLFYSYQDLGKMITPLTWLPTYYASLSEAESVVDLLKKRDADQHEWTPVTEGRKA